MKLTIQDKIDCTAFRRGTEQMRRFLSKYDDHAIAACGIILWCTVIATAILFYKVAIDRAWQ